MMMRDVKLDGERIVCGFSCRDGRTALGIYFPVDGEKNELPGDDRDGKTMEIGIELTVESSARDPRKEGYTEVWTAGRNAALLDTPQPPPPPTPPPTPEELARRVEFLKTLSHILDA